MKATIDVDRPFNELVGRTQAGGSIKILRENHIALFHEPIEAARARLGIVTPTRCLDAQERLGPAMASYLTQRTPAAA